MPLLWAGSLQWRVFQQTWAAGERCTPEWLLRAAGRDSTAPS